MCRILLLIATVALVSCVQKEISLARNSENEVVITGEIGAFNESDNFISVAISAGSNSYAFGAVSSDAFKVSGFAQFSVGGRLEVHWRETFPNDSGRSSTAIFDSKELADVAAHVRGIKFTYLGNEVWQLEVFKALHMKAPDLIKTIKNTSVNLMNPESSCRIFCLSFVLNDD